jgi:hypothetical protein
MSGKQGEKRIESDGKKSGKRGERGESDGKERWAICIY